MLYRPTFTKAIPAGAELFARKGERFARWKTPAGASRSARVTTTKAGAVRLVFTSPRWRCRYRDGAGVVRDVATGCRDEVAAQSVANELLRRAELVKAGTITAAEDAAAAHAGAPLDAHLSAYVLHLQAQNVTAAHRATTAQRLRRMAADCGFATLA